MSVYKVVGQTPTVTANFTYPEFKVTIIPELPTLCSQGSVKVKCIESYKKYTWKHKDGTILSGQEVNITLAGDWELSISNFDDPNFICEQKTFKVYDLSDNDDIKIYFQKSGFYSIPI